MAYETLGDLISAFREDEKDAVAPFFWSDAQLTRWTNEGLAEFAIQSASIYDQTSNVTLIPYGIGQGTVALDPCILDVLDAWVDGNPRLHYRRERFCDDYGMIYCGRGIRFDQAGFLQIYPVPQEAGVMRLKVMRKPIRELCNKADRIPDLLPEWRRHLLPYLGYKAYRVRDSDMFDPSASAAHLKDFEDACQNVREQAILRRGDCSRPIRSSWC